MIDELLDLADNAIFFMTQLGLLIKQGQINFALFFQCIH